MFDGAWIGGETIRMKVSEQQAQATGVDRDLMEKELVLHEPGLQHISPDSSAVTLLYLAWRRRRFVIRFTLVGAVASLALAFLIPKRFDSTVQLVPPDPQSNSSLGMMASAAMMGGGGSGGAAAGGGLGGLVADLLGSKNSGAFFVEILRSRTVEDDLIRRFDLRNVYHDRYWEYARKDLAKKTDIREDKKSGVIAITVSDRSPERAQQLGQAYVEELDKLVALLSTSAARRERIFIEGRLKTVKQDLDSAAVAFSQFASKNSAIDISAQTKAMVEAGADLQAQLMAAESQLQGLQTIYSDNNIRVRTLKSQIAELHRQLEGMSGMNSATSPYDPQKDLYPPLRELPVLGVKWADLYRNTKIEETLYQLLTQQYEIAKIQEAKEIPTVKVLDAPDLPEKKAFPPRLIILLLGIMLAFCMSIVWLLVEENWSKLDFFDPRKALVRDVLKHLRSTRVQLRRVS